jgi:hypothetical protein
MLKKCRLRSPCRCGSTDGLITHGSGPHMAKLVCWECGSYIRWLTRTDYQRAKGHDLVNDLAELEEFA